MGAKGSSLKIPGFSSSECLAYAASRKQAAKELLDAHKALTDATNNYAESLKTAGTSFVVFSAGTSLFDGTSLASDALPPPLPPTGLPDHPGQAPRRGLLSENESDSSEEESEDNDEGRHPPLRANSDKGGASPYNKSPNPQEIAAADSTAAADSSAPAIQGSTAATGSSAAADSSAATAAQHGPGAQVGQGSHSVRRTHSTRGMNSAGAVVPYGGAGQLGQLSQRSVFGQRKLGAAPSVTPMLGDRTLDTYAKQLNALFLEGAHDIKPLMDVLDLGPPIQHMATPPLEVSRLPDGRPEPLGQTLQKLVIWEWKLKADVQTMDGVKSELRKCEKNLQRAQTKANKKPSDISRLDKAQSRVNDASARLASLTASVGDTYKQLEWFKAECLLPQVLRLMPGLAALWRSAAEVYGQQQKIAAQLARHEDPHITRTASVGSEQGRGLTDDALRLSGSAFMEAMGAAVHGTSKAQHEAIRKLEDSFKHLPASLGALCMAQRKFCSALMTWLAKTKAVPASFPHPPPGTPPPGQYVASWAAPAQEQAQEIGAQEGGQVVVSKDHLYLAVTEDWTRTLEKLPDTALQNAVLAFCEWLGQAYEVQKQEMKEAKNLEEASKQLNKVEDKLSVAQQKEQELRLTLAAAGEVLPGQERAHQAKERQAQAAASKAAALKTTVEVARRKYVSEKISLERYMRDGKVAMAAAVQKGLPVVFQQAASYASVACQGYGLVQSQHAPWLAQTSQG